MVVVATTLEIDMSVNQVGEIIGVGPLGAALSGSKTQALIKTPRLEVIRLVLPKGKTIPEHKAPGEITVHCLEGSVKFAVSGQVHALVAGSMICLSAGVPHDLEALEDSSVLLTIVR